MTDTAAGSAVSTRKRIVVGVDGSDVSTAALRRGIDLARALDADVIAVTAWMYPRTLGPAPITSWSPEDDARELLLHIQEDVFGGDVPDWFSHEAHHGTPANALIVASADAEMLVVGNRGRGGFRGLLLGSVSSTVAEYAECPVLIYHHESREVFHRDPADHP